MEIEEEVMAVGSKDQSHILKGKRTKRQRPMSSFVLTMAAASSSSSADGGGGGGGGGGSAAGFDDLSHYSLSGADLLSTSPSNSGEFTQTSVEEEDMANCLMLLAKGRSRKSPESVLGTTNKAGVDVYQCKTCDRCFPSFQALGGHRASHKKPKVTLQEKKSSVMMAHQEKLQFNDENTTLSLQIRSRDSRTPNNKSRVHECSTCGAEFTSGQALGGHMRRHRPMPLATSSHEDSQEVKKPRTILSLDLNLPAPEDDHRESQFPFASTEEVIVFSPSALVDCHY